MIVFLVSALLVFLGSALLVFAMLRCGGYDKASFVFLGVWVSLVLFTCFGALLTG